MVERPELTEGELATTQGDKVFLQRVELLGRHVEDHRHVVDHDDRFHGIVRNLRSLEDGFVILSDEHPGTRRLYHSVNAVHIRREIELSLMGRDEIEFRHLLFVGGSRLDGIRRTPLIEEERALSHITLDLDEELDEALDLVGRVIDSGDGHPLARMRICTVRHQIYP